MPYLYEDLKLTYIGGKKNLNVRDCLWRINKGEIVPRFNEVQRNLSDNEELITWAIQIWNNIFAK